MGQLESGLSKDDLEVLIEAMGDWEAIGNHEFHVMQMVRQAPMPPEDHEAFEFIQKLKEHFKEREKEIKDMRCIRQERAILLKAKILLIKKDIGVNELFDAAASAASDSASSAAPKERVVTKKVPVDPDVVKKLEMAEFFIKDVGIWKNYEKFLEEKNAEAESEA